MFLLYFLTALLSLCCVGCQKPQASKEPKKNLNLTFKYDPITLDPRKNGDPLSCTLINMLYEGLLRLEEDGSLSLGLVESIKISKNKTRYTLHLKTCYWSDGSLITAEDIVKSWKSMLAPSFPGVNAYFLYPVKHAKEAKNGLVSVEEVGVYAQDNSTLVIKLEHPTPSFLKMLAFTTFYPVKSTTTSSLEVFSGPFCLQEWKHNDYIILKKNPWYWNQDKVKLDTITIHIVADEHTSLKLHQLEEIDWIGTFFSPIPQDALACFAKQKALESKDYAGTSSCFFNIHSYPFNNINIRKAFAYAIDKDAIINHICHNDPLKAYGLVPPLFRNQKTLKLAPEHSKNLAQHHFQLGLDELHLKRQDFPKLILTIFHSELEKTLAQALQEQWISTLGLSVSIEQLDVKIFLDKLYKRNYQFCLMSIIAQYYDSLNFLERFTEQEHFKNFTSWSHPEFKQLIEISSSYPKSYERQAILDKAEKILIDEAPLVPLFHLKLSYQKHPWLKNVEISPLGCVDFRYAYFGK
jgi:oligopeptide transport system substrate-binding protein